MLLSDDARRRYDAFWDRTPTDRACMYLTAPGDAPALPEPATLEQKWADMADREARTLYAARNTRCFAEAFPCAFPNMGPGCLAATISGSYRFAESTVWFDGEPTFIPDWETRPTPRVDRNSEMFRMIDDLTERFLRHTDEVVTSITDVGGSYDLVAALRGTEKLLYDMYDYPEEVKRFKAELFPLWADYFKEYSTRLIAAQGGMSSWMPIWSEKPWYPLQCDYCAMLGPDMFREFILPDLAAQARLMPRAVYHLDGPGELPHLDMILAIPEINAIQWTSGAGNPPMTDPCWFDLYRHIQAAGKGLVILGADKNELEGLFTHVSQRGMFLHTDNVSDEREANEIIAMGRALNR